MADRPTIYLTNAASRKPPYRGPGRAWTIMAAPRPQYGEAGDGAVRALVPPIEWVRAAKAGEMSVDEYSGCYGHLLADRLDRLRPGKLAAATDAHLLPVRDGDTLLCACSRANAAAGQCHRVWAAEALAQAGWHVVLDGKPLEADRG